MLAVGAWFRHAVTGRAAPAGSEVFGVLTDGGFRASAVFRPRVAAGNRDLDLEQGYAFLSGPHAKPAIDLAEHFLE